MNEREEFANIIFKYVVKAHGNNIHKAIDLSEDIISEVYENIPDLYECEDIPFINLYSLLNPDNEICPIDISGLENPIEHEIKKEYDKCVKYYCT